MTEQYWQKAEVAHLYSAVGETRTGCLMQHVLEE